MMTGGFPYLLCLYSMIESSYSQYMPVKKPSKSSCDDVNKTAMVEHFFNVIFTEFHSNPPVCVCVQMCVEQPAYCYPNGCLKKIDSRRRDVDDLRPSPSHLYNHDAPKMFLVDEKNNYAHILNNNADTNSNAPRQITESSDFFSDPLKDMYKTLFKLKRVPKVELRYNLREQVKNMKSDILRLETEDVSKTRWPKAHHRLFRDQKVYVSDKHNDRKNVDIGKVNIFKSTPERGPGAYASKYFKRDLSRNGKSNLDDLMEKSESQDKVFSIEELIENLIGNSFEGANDTKVEFNVKLDKVNDNTVNATLNLTENQTNGINNNKDEVMCVVSMNLTDEKTDKNKYADDSLVAEVFKKWSNYTFNEMIAELSKQIELENNTSMEMIKQIPSNNSSIPTENSLINSTGIVTVEVVGKRAVTAVLNDINVVESESSTHNALDLTNYTNSRNFTRQPQDISNETIQPHLQNKSSETIQPHLQDKSSETLLSHLQDKNSETLQPHLQDRSNETVV